MTMRKGKLPVRVLNYGDMANKLCERSVFCFISPHSSAILKARIPFTRQDIRALLSEWTEELSQCERIFIRASVANRKIFITDPSTGTGTKLSGSDTTPIKKGDDRLRGFPFPTRRPVSIDLIYKLDFRDRIDENAM